MKQKAAFFFAFSMLSMLLTNVVVYIHKYNVSQYAEFLETEESESNDFIKIKTDHVYQMFHNTVKIFSIKESDRIYCLMHQKFISSFSVKPETPPPNL